MAGAVMSFRRAASRRGGIAVAILLAACASAPPAPPPPPPDSSPVPATAPATPSGPAVAPVPAASAPAAGAAADIAHPFSACLMPDENRTPVIDEARRRLHETVCGAALWFDTLFGEGDLAAARSAYGRLEVINAWSQFEGDDTRVRLNARIQLPALEHRLSVFIGRDNDEDFVRDRSEGQGLRSQASEIDRVDDWFAGLGYRLHEFSGVRSDFQVGAHGLARPTVFARLRLARPFVIDDTDTVWQRLTPFVNNQDGVGITSSTDVDHVLSPAMLLRWGTAGTVSQDSAGLEWRSALLLFHLLPARHAIAYELFVRGATAAPEPLAEYGGRVLYRLPLFRARMFTNLVLGYSWPRVDPTLPRDGSLGASIGLELPFGSTADGAGVRQ